MNLVEGEVLLVNKPLRWTSFDVVNKIRYSLKKKTGKKYKVGHAGTLDPLATGLLIICTGNFTKQAETFQGFDKVYTGKILIGKTTPSYDLETAFDSEQPIENVSTENILTAAQEIQQQTEQLPPIFSAIKKDGKTAYSEARKGNEVKLEPRVIKIHSFKITDINLPYISFEVKCSKGAYIRSIAHDFGKALGCGACLAELCRTEVGEWNLNNAKTLEEILKEIEETNYVKNAAQQ
ncbi:MAG: tRNA pseudouridine(55) synthase TruB [Chitinophagales bacterium]|nr:tRNA pseudouridine(55) synthase TruB [Chitinophagales bacterium]